MRAYPLMPSLYSQLCKSRNERVTHFFVRGLRCWIFTRRGLDLSQTPVVGRISRPCLVLLRHPSKNQKTPYRSSGCVGPQKDTVAFADTEQVAHYLFFSLRESCVVPLDLNKGDRYIFSEVSVEWGRSDQEIGNVISIFKHW